MKISYKWLRQYFNSEVSSKEILSALPLMGFDVEETEIIGPPTMDFVVVGEVHSFTSHPNADRLRLCQVRTDNDGSCHSIICGAKNFKQGDRVMVALPGAVLPGNFKIKKSKLRGIESEGMLCSAKELNINDENDGILILDDSIELGTPINTVYSDTDIIFHLDITPNRVDVLSHIGLAREIVARFGGSLTLPLTNTSLNECLGHNANKLLENLELNAPEDCFEYNTICIEGVEVSISPDWLKSALDSVGLRSINNIVDITNFVLHETGQPLHAFDADKIEGKSIVVRNAFDGESITTLDEKKHALDSSMLIISDNKKPVAIAGVMGGADVEVTNSSSSIILEVAYFKPTSIRMTARRLGISSDSSYRFERGVDPKGLNYALHRACALILELAGGTVVGCSSLVSDSGQASDCLEVKPISFSPNAMEAFIGFSVSSEQVKSVFKSLNFRIKVVSSDDWEVEVPSYRGDISRAVDLYEEFIRIFGTDKIPDVGIKAGAINASDHPIFKFNQLVGNFLASKSFNEAYLYTLRNVDEFKCLYGTNAPDTQLLKLDNPLQSDQSHLRNSLIPGLLDVLELNYSRQNPLGGFFERGRVFRIIDGAITELISLGFIASSNYLGRSWIQRDAFDFYSAKSIMEYCIGLLPVKLNQMDWMPIKESSLWQPDHSATLGSLDSSAFEAEIGLLNVQNIKSQWGLSEQLIAGSLVIKLDLFDNKVVQSRYKNLSNQPASTKDLALIVGKETLASEVKIAVESSIKSLIKDFDCEWVEIFDVYEGEGLEDNQKSIALRMQFRAHDRTLKDAEVNSLFEAIQLKICNETNFHIRK